MITYEEQKKLLQEIKQRPDVKKLHTAAKICQTIGTISFIVGIGFVLWIVGDILAKKSEERINQILAIETAEREKAKETPEISETPTEEAAANAEEYVEKSVTEKQQSVEGNDGLFSSAKEDEKDEEQARVERLVSLSKKNNVMGVLVNGIFFFSCILLFFMPIGKVLGIANISVFDLVKDRIQNGTASLLYSLDVWWVDFFCIMFCVIGIVCGIASIVTLIAALVGSGEKAIRETKGQIIGELTIQELRSSNVTTGSLTMLIFMLIAWAIILFFPIAFLVEMKGLVSVNIFTAVIIGLLFVVDYIVVIANSVFNLTNKKDMQLISGIGFSYNRYKRYQRLK
ncbi:MAG: hypothetical protein IJ329_03365 [Clostridia bacterium]|nr:hypothetical protein [Clostridia bacterium]